MQIVINDKSSRPINVMEYLKAALSAHFYLCSMSQIYPLRRWGIATQRNLRTTCQSASQIRGWGRNIKQLQAALDKLSQWCDRWRIKLSQAKSRLIHFTGRKRNKPTETVRINDIDIEIYRDVKFLGITFDRALNFNTHFTNQQRIAAGRRNKLN